MGLKKINISFQSLKIVKIMVDMLPWFLWNETALTYGSGRIRIHDPFTPQHKIIK